MITHLEPEILECEVKWALKSITTNKASGGDRIPVELVQILKDDAMKVLDLICQQIWKTQQWPQDWNRSVATAGFSRFAGISSPAVATGLENPAVATGLEQVSFHSNPPKR